MLAQHRDDQAETVLLQLVRGAGVAGLAGMAAVRKAGGPTLLRPLLGATRAEIERYARDRGLEWVEDESNADERRARNFVRRRVMPLLVELNAAAAANLARSAAHLAEAHELARAVAALDAREAMREGRLSAAALARLPAARARNLLRWTITEAGLVAPGRAHGSTRSCGRSSARARTQRSGSRSTARRSDAIAMPSGSWRSRRPRRPRSGPAGRGGPAWHLPELGGTLTFKATTGGGVAARALDRGAVEVRLRSGGERLQPDGRRPRRTLKALLQESAIPPWERERLPLLYSGGKLVAVPGIGVAAEAAAAAGERGWTVSWVPDRLKLPRSTKPMIK